MKRIILISIISILPFFGFAQLKLMEENVDKIDFSKPNKGQNMKNYSHWFIGYAGYVGKSEGVGADINYGTSDVFSVGVRYKRKLAEFFALGAESWYSAEDFKIAQKKDKVIPTSDLHKKEDLRFNNISGATYMRFNFGKRGNILGKYMDLGAYGTWSFDIRHTYTDKVVQVNKINGYRTVKTVHKRLVYTNPLNYGAIVRFGINRYVIYGTYRLSDLFDADFKTMANVELPRITVGVQIGLHK